jgi:hypothetical protein
MLQRIAAIVLIAGAAATLSACAGKNFVRPDAAELRVGQSSYAQVLAKMGDPRNTGEVLTNGEKVKTITYVYASTGGEPLEADVIPARAQSFYFHNDKLVGQQFLSSFKADHSNFDDTKVTAIEKGKTTRAEVLQALGRPSATFVSPMVKETVGEAVGYGYQTTRGGAFSGFKFYHKALRVTFDAADRVLDVEYVTSATQ